MSSEFNIKRCSNIYNYVIKSKLGIGENARYLFLHIKICSLYIYPNQSLIETKIHHFLTHSKMAQKNSQVYK